MQDLTAEKITDGTVLVLDQSLWVRLLDLVKVFLRLGFVGFGGPFAMIAMMEEETVKNKKWLTAEKFNQAFALIKVLPGATATQLSIYIGRQRAGALGGALTGLVFLLPSAVFVLILSVFYVRFHTIPQASSLFDGMQVAALVVIAESVMRMAQPYSKSRQALWVALFSGVVIFFKPSYEPLVILIFGLVGIFGYGVLAAFVGTSPFKFQFLSSATAKLTAICLKTGFLVFGTGLAIIPVLEADVVGKYHWLTHAEFLDGLAIGQITPGPVSTTATFIGYKVGGFSGAAWATAAIFASAFFNMLFLLPMFESRIKNSPRLKSFTQWAFPAVIGGIMATTIRLAMTTLSTWILAVWLVSVAAIVFRWRPPAWATIPLSGVLLFALNLARG